MLFFNGTKYWAVRKFSTVPTFPKQLQIRRVFSVEKSGIVKIFHSEIKLLVKCLKEKIKHILFQEIKLLAQLVKVSVKKKLTRKKAERQVQCNSLETISLNSLI